MYKIFPNRTANLFDALGFPGRRRYREFWALRGVDIEIRKGERLGIIGRNGAGKSTLLKLITGNIAPTEGAVEVNGEVQALIEAGAGFHPEFTGEENIRAALTLQGVAPRRMTELVEEIADFTELGEFLAQPFRTYSAGMQARLAFATATAIEPEILIVDEMLSAGDAYFSSKASERMRRLVDSGASLLLVSHGLDQITMFCDQAIWLDRGRVVERGRSIDVVRAYQQFTRILDERRLRAKNRKAQAGLTASHQLDNYADQLVARLSVSDGHVEIDRVELKRDGEVEELVRIGDAQDADESHAAFVVLENSDWSGPLETERGHARSLESTSGDPASGSVNFNLFSFYSESAYELTLRCRGTGRLRAELLRDDTVLAALDVSAGREWCTELLELEPTTKLFAAVGAPVTDEDYVDAVAGKPPGKRARTSVAGIAPPVPPRTDPAFSAEQTNGKAPSHWPGEGSLRIESVLLLGPAGEQAVYDAGSPMTLAITARAHRAAVFEVTPVAVLYRLDGVLVSSHVGDPFTVELEQDELITVRLDFARLNLGDGGYTFSVALYRELVHPGPSEAYDLVDRSYEFEVVGNEPFHNGVFQHPANWQTP